MAGANGWMRVGGGLTLLLSALFLSGGHRAVAQRQANVLLLKQSLDLPVDDPERSQSQMQAAIGLWGPLSEAAAVKYRETKSLAEADALFVDGLETIAAELQAAGVPGELAALGKLLLAKWRYEARLFTLLDELELDLERAFAGETICLPLRMEYWNLTALMAIERANYSTAQATFVRALDAVEQSHLPRGLLVNQQVQVLSAEGLLLLKLGDYGAARRSADAVLAIVDPVIREMNKGNKPVPPNLAAMAAAARLTRSLSLENYESPGSDPQALARRRLLLDEAHGLLERAGLPPMQLPSAVAAGQGMVEYLAGDLAAAQTYFQAAQQMVAADSTGVRPAEARVNLGWVTLARGDAQGAQTSFAAAVESLRATQSRTHPRVSEGLVYLGRAQQQAGKKADAAKTLREAVALREELLDDMIASSLAPRDCLAMAQDLRMHFEAPQWPGALDTFFELAPRLGIEASEQYDHVLVWKGVSARVYLPRVPRDALPELKKSDVELREVRRQLRSAYFAGAGPSDEQEAKADSLRREATELERKVRGLLAGQGQAAERAQPNWQDIRDALPPGAVLVDVILARRLVPPTSGAGPPLARGVYYAFVLRAGQPVRRIDLGPAQDLDRAAEKFCETCAPRRGAQGKLSLAQAAEVDAAGASLAGVLKPLLAELDSDVRLLLVAGDGALHRLPLAACPLPQSRRLLIEQLDVAYVPRAEALLSQRAPAASAPNLLLVADVDYTAAGVANLDSTRAEAQAIEEAFGRRFEGASEEFLRGADATPAHVRDKLAGRRFIHLATHGLFRPQALLGDDAANASYVPRGWEAQLDAGVVLSGPPIGAGGKNMAALDRFLLTGADFAELDLSAAELVVLSACDSGLGHLVAGQGLIGLQSALDEAGVREIVCSHWEVSDEATSQLMADFYARLWAPGDKTPVEALCAAQRKMLTSPLPSDADKKPRHPFYWSGFAVTLCGRLAR